MLCVVLLMLCDRLNCSVICDELSELDEVILVMFVMWLSECFRGVVMVVVMVLGLVFGSDVLIEMVGKFICGSGDIGSKWNVVILVNVMLMVSSVVVIGWVMKVVDRFIVVC